MKEITAEHPIYRTLFPIAKIPQVPSMQFWRSSGGATSEMDEYSANAHMAAITDKQGRIMVLMTHNTDIADSWEREGDDPEFFFNFSPNGYAVGLNAVLYAMTPLNRDQGSGDVAILRMPIVAILLAASVAAAQEQWDRFRGGGCGRNRYPPRYPTATSFDGGFNFCRLMYTSDRREAGGSGWSTDYWDADINFSTRLGELTKTTISRQPNGDAESPHRAHCRSGARSSARS